MIECTKCKKIRTLEDFNFKNRSRDLRHSQCKECTRQSVKKHYSENRQYYLDKTEKRNTASRLQISSYIRDYLSKNPCIDCVESDITVLEFDHKKNSGKLGAVSTLIRARCSLEKIKEEIEKCEIRCANCHRRKTAKDFHWSKNNKHPSFNG